MATLSGLLGDGAAVIVIGLCVVVSMYMHHLPGMTHPWIRRLLIVLMYSAGAALILTPVGAWVVGRLEWAGGYAGGFSSGIGWSAVVIGSLLMCAAVFVCLVWAPDMFAAYIAVVTPLILALVPGGFMHSIYSYTTYPAQQAVESIGRALGG
jgi:hypothetical protein